MGTPVQNPYEMFIDRMPVPQNRKCEGCVHYDGNALSKGGACDVGKLPANCGDGSSPRYGYAALSELRPDQVDDLATPAVNGPHGLMNEMAKMESVITMKTVNLGDEDIAWAKQLQQKIMKSDADEIAYHGHVNIHAPEVPVRNVRPLVMFQVAKSLHTNYFAPRKQKKFSVGDVLTFLAEHGGMQVSDADYAAAGYMVQKSDRQPSAKPKVKKVGSGGDDDKPAGVKKPADDTQEPTGGNIIGHTKSGKSVLGPNRDLLSRADAHVRAHSDFSADDHRDAATVHADRAKTEANDLGPAYRVVADAHRRTASKLTEKEKNEQQKADASKKPNVKKAG